MTKAQGGEGRVGGKRAAGFTSALGRLRRASGDTTGIDDIAARFGLRAIGDIPSDDRAFRSMVLGGASLDVIRHEGPALIEFGNHGARFLLGQDRKPSRRGYVAIRHALSLPQIFVEARHSGPLTMIALAQAVLEVTPLDSGEAPDVTTLTGFKRGAVKFNHSPKVGKGFELFCRPEDEATCAAMLSEAAVATLMEISKAFDVEVVDGWLVAYSSYGDVVTCDDEIWRWIFSVTSRLLDLLAAWAAVAGGRDAGDVWAPGAVPFYTGDRVGRPRKLNNRPASIKD